MNIHHENTANKLRPKTFDELTGQEFIVSTICNSIEQNNIAPAYLFSGPRGVGKTSAARLVALAINRPEGTPVNNLSYSGSEDIRLGKSLDVIEIDGASYTSVENVRNIREEILYAPVHFAYKVYIIDEVHMLSNSAFNALLKTIEEPPPYVVFIFATTESHKLPATIRSRCQQFSFKLISVTEITTKLEEICTNENIEAESTALQWIAKESQGSFRDAYTLFDQIKAFSNNSISIQSIKSHLGLAGLDTLNDIFLTCVQEDRKKAIELLGDLFNKGVTVEQLIMESAEYLRSLLLLKAGIQSSAILGYAPELFIAQIYETLTIEQLERALAMLLACYKDLRYSVNPRFEVELVFAQLCELSRYLSPQQLVAQLEKIRDTSATNTPLQATIVAPQPKATTESKVQLDKPTLSNAVATTIIAPTNNSPSHTAVATESQPSLHDTENSLQAPTLQDIIDVGNKKPVSIEPEEAPVKTSSPLWAQIVSQIRTANLSLSLALDSAESSQEDNNISLMFSDEFSYKKYTTYEKKIMKLTNDLTDSEIIFRASLTSNPQEVLVSSTSDLQSNTVEQLEQSNMPTETQEHDDVANVLNTFGGKIVE